MFSKFRIMHVVMVLVGVAVGSIGTLSLQLPASGRSPAADGHVHTPGEPAESHGAQTVKPAAISRIADADWCSEHRVPESQCTRCRPELASQFQASRDWCPEHGLPESHCRLCNPNLVFAQEPPPASAPPAQFAPVSVYFPPNATACATDGAIIQFKSIETAHRAGLTVEPALEAPSSPEIEAPAEIVFDATLTSAVTTTVSVTIIRWLVEPGQAIGAGALLAEVESAEIAGMRADFLEASAEWLKEEEALKRQDGLYQAQLISAADYQSASAEGQVALMRLKRAAGLLRACGMSEADLQALQVDHSVTARFYVRAQATGTLVERKAPIGELMPAGASLAVISDPASLWAEAQVPDHALRRIHAGQRVDFLSEGYRMARIPGQVIWVSQFLNDATRTGTVRAKLWNAPDTVRAHQFGRLLVQLAAEQPAVLVPRDAVQWEGCCHVVFVRESEDRYRPRKVEIERGDTESYRVMSGLRPGEEVVVHGSYLLKTELKKSSIGAGCCELGAES